MNAQFIMGPEVLSVAITAIIIFGSCVINFSRREIIKNVPTADWLIRWFFRKENHTPGLSSAACMTWTIIGGIFCFIIPAVAGNSFLGTPFGVIVTLSSAILAPCLVGVYVYLIRSVDSFVDECQKDEFAFRYLKDSKSGAPLSKAAKVFAFWIGHGLLASIAILTLLQAVNNQGINPSPGQPWADHDHPFTYYGSIYYVLRGLHSYMVLALLATFGYVWYLLNKKIEYKENTLIHNAQLNVPPIIKKICVAMSASVLLCTLSVTFHGAAITIQMLGEPEKAGELFIKSTWVFWLVSLFIATVVLFSVLSFFKDYLEISANRILAAFGADKLIDLTSRSTITIQDNNFDGEVNLADIKQYTDDLNKVRTLKESIPVAPITGTGLKTVFGAIVFQIINIIAGISAVFIG